MIPIGIEMFACVDSVICADDPEWRNSKFGSGTASCVDFARDPSFCSGDRPFNEEIRTACKYIGCMRGFRRRA